ncbi:type II secretion system F family protein [Limnobacter humi]|uniref:Type II secretion system F family protein n=1 Tax=Limnobacter humi TaxID=1778671 RepID=A0ABT1WJ70_9BURK|nr:type II secretion system F family protein [Limnobacter humi]MCQ8897572.1 type II secretion system F family protein [Limnobacter humi]
MSLCNFRIRYLAPSMLDATGRPDPALTGYFRHELVVAASKPREAMQAVIDRGGVVLELTEIKPSGQIKRLFNPSVNRSYKQKFLQALAFNVRSGLSPEKALEQVILGELGEPRVALNESLNALRQGFGFVQSLDILNWFDDSTLAVLSAGEAAGQLSKALETAVSFYEKGSSTLKLMFGAVTWTVLDLIMAVSTVIGMRFGLIEQLKKTPLLSDDPGKVARYQTSLHLAELVNNGLLVLSFVFVVVLLYFTMMLFSPDAKVRAQALGFLEKTPVLGPLLACSSVSATTRVLSSLLRGGVTFLTAVSIARKGTLVPSVNAMWGDIIARSEIGEHPAAAFNHPMLDSSERLLIRAHRDQSQLAECLDSISSTREDRANTLAKKFAAFAFVASLVYSGIAVLFSLAVVYLQNEVVLTGGG